jgi:hypothetical protein
LLDAPPLYPLPIKRGGECFYSCEVKNASHDITL